MLKELFGSRLRAKLVGWLFSHPDEAFFGRQIASRIGEDQKNVSSELARLHEMGLLTCEPSGRQKYYQANRDCPIFEELKGLAIKTTGVADVIRQALEPLSKRITVAFLYGSQASGEFTALSDVDLMVVGDVGFGEVAGATYQAQQVLQREINPSVYSVDEFRQKAHGGHHFVGSVLRGAKVFLIGDDDDLAGLAE